MVTLDDVKKVFEDRPDLLALLFFLHSAKLISKMLIDLRDSDTSEV